VRDVQRNRLLNRADVFVMPSLSEPFGLVALEAAQRNTPVIVSKNAGVSEVMPSSIQVDFWDIEKMAQEIERLVTKPEVHTTVITNQLRDLRQVTWENAAKRLQEVYKRAFRGR
jgi:glycosyltransferase involved in cell wall biosynthesis